MKHLTAKISILIACAIIMLHAVVPHHHHDCEEGAGLVFETELCCHCDSDCSHHDCDHRHSHHPFDICLLQELLSHLVFSTSDDHFSMASLMKTVASNYWFPALAAFFPTPQVPILPEIKVHQPIRAVLLVPAPLLGVASLRAPPFLSF